MDDLSFVQLQPVLFCHDQEPLHFDYYADDRQHMKEFIHSIEKYNKVISPKLKNLNLRWVHPTSGQKIWILLHSELNSEELSKYESTGDFVGAYWWSHAMLSLDWYRFAESDPALNVGNNYQKLFLIYCRDTTGLRTYRKTFLDFIEKQDILSQFQI
jgi:hypothetical protein